MVERESERERDVKFPLIPDFMRESVCVCEREREREREGWCRSSAGGCSRQVCVCDGEKKRLKILSFPFLTLLERECVCVCMCVLCVC